MQKRMIRCGLVYGLIGLVLIAVGGVGCKRKEYTAPTLGMAGGDTFLGGGNAQSIQLWTQTDESLSAPGAAATVMIIARVLNAAGRPMPDGTQVTWLAKVGTLDKVTTTTTDGIASVKLTFPKNFTSCSVVTAISGEAEASIGACASVISSNITIQASDTDVAWNEEIWVRANLTTDGKPDVGFQVTFTLDPDDVAVVYGYAVVVTDGAGNATVRIMMRNNSTTEIAILTVTATASDGRTASIQIQVRPHP